MDEHIGEEDMRKDRATSRISTAGVHGTCNAKVGSSILSSGTNKSVTWGTWGSTRTSPSPGINDPLCLTESRFAVWSRLSKQHRTSEMALQTYSVNVRFPQNAGHAAQQVMVQANNADDARRIVEGQYSGAIVNNVQWQGH